MKRKTLHNKLKIAAEASGRTLQEEIQYRLVLTFAKDMALRQHELELLMPSAPLLAIIMTKTVNDLFDGAWTREIAEQYQVPYELMAERIGKLIGSNMDAFERRYFRG